MGAYKQSGTEYLQGVRDVVGSYVVFDPTGRDLADCMEVGRVVAVSWMEGDDGNVDGSPRPLMTVVPNGGGERISVSRVAMVLPEGY